jgi:hypothetical protein
MVEGGRRFYSKQRGEWKGRGSEGKKKSRGAEELVRCAVRDKSRKEMGIDLPFIEQSNSLRTFTMEVIP